MRHNTETEQPDSQSLAMPNIPNVTAYTGYTRLGFRTVWNKNPYRIYIIVFPDLNVELRST